MVVDVDSAPDLPLRFQRPMLPPAEQIEGYLSRSRSARWFSNGGPCWELLRERLAQRVDAYCIPVASGTAGLIAAVAAVLGDGRAPHATEAILPSFTFPATAQAAIWNDLRPRLLDVDPDHWHLDAAALEHELTRRRGNIAVVIAVSSFGTPPPAEVRHRWEAACRAAGVPLVVDSAAGFGAVAEDNRAVGAQGDVEVVSFHATKPFAVGEGGAVFTRDTAIRDRVQSAINFGFAPDRQVVSARAFNGKMSELHAAVALAVLDDLDRILNRRRSFAQRIRGAARSTLRWQWGCERSTWQFVPVAFEDRATREAAIRATAGTVDTRVYYEPLHLTESIASLGTVAPDVQVTEDLWERLLALPMANDLSERELELVMDAVGGPGRSLRSAQAVRDV